MLRPAGDDAVRLVSVRVWRGLREERRCRMSDIKYAYPLILNKVASPHYVTPTLRRARLLDLLHGNAGCRAIVIAADAGYGKTTLLWQWEREVAFPCYWFKLDRNDRDWTLHVSYLIEAISQRHKGFGRRTHSMLQQLGSGPGTSRPGVVAYLLAEMHERLTEPCTFIVDDWQYVNAVTEVRGLWNQILRDAPPTCRFVFSSRAKPRLQFARFKTHSGYAKVATEALRFTEDEIKELFNDIYSDPLGASELTELDRRTEGWAAGLQLVGVSLRERRTPGERREFIESITASSDSDLFEFLAEEVLDQQPEDTRNFLLATSILHQVTLEVAERLAGIHDGRRQLLELEHRGLFTYRLDGDRYRYHNLFRDFLERRLAMERSEAEILGLHIHAASYFETTHAWPEAIHHYLRAGLQRQAARLLARYGEDLASEGRLGLVDGWLQQLPDKPIRENARLSLLHGEALGLRGDWDPALEALHRARVYFARKGDRRMEALACLKLSTVHHYRGDPDVAAGHARQGLDLVPADAVATRLRLEGNLAITHGLAHESIESVAETCKRIAVEAAAHGLDHFAAIALHNLGETYRLMGRVREAGESLHKASIFWASLPPNPFSDDYEYVVCLLLQDEVGRAEERARAGEQRTRAWKVAHCNALRGVAEVAAYQGRFSEGVAALSRAIAEPAGLGVARSSGCLLIELMFLADSPIAELEQAVATIRDSSPDDRYGSIALAQALLVHRKRECHGECSDARSDIANWEARGGRLMATCTAVKLGALALEHSHGKLQKWTVDSLLRARDAGILRYLKWWTRLYARHAQRLAVDPVGASVLCDLVESDPEGWRLHAATALPHLSGATRERLLAALVNTANRELVMALRGVPGADVADARRLLIQRQATRIFIRTFGSVDVHRGSWIGPTIEIDKRRLRALLGLLTAFSGRVLSRDEAIDILWPDASPAAAVNNLNQAVFQLRRLIDPTYRDGESPQYILSSAESVEFSPDLVHTDLDEARRHLRRSDQATNPVEAQGLLAATVRLIRGEFLPELRYEDWAAPVQATIHSELRAGLLPIAERNRSMIDPELAVQAALALTRLDEFDERAQVALAVALRDGGRRVAGKEAITRFAAKVKRELDEDPSPLVAATLLKVTESSNGI